MVVLTSPLPPRAGDEDLVGMLVNTAVVRWRLGDDPTFGEPVERTHELCMDAAENQELPFRWLVEALNPARDVAHNPVVQVMFVKSGPGEKPVFVDFDSPLSVDVLSRAVRKAADPVPVRVTEMLPAPDQMWLVDGRGQRYASELRIVTVEPGPG